MQFEPGQRDLANETPVDPASTPGSNTPTPPSRLSPSGASTFEQCPRRWRFRYVDRLPDPPGEAALAGSFAHRVLELLMQREPVERTIEVAKTIARQEWPETEIDDDFQALGFDPARSKQFRWKSWLAVEGLWALEDPTTVHVKATEPDIKAELGGVPFRGIVDRLDQEADGIVVTDYKSGKTPSPRYRRARLDQVLLYAAAVMAATGEMPVRARLLYLGQQPVGIDVNQSEIDGVTEKLVDTWRSINTSCSADEFEPRTGPLCGWCPYSEGCSEGTKEVNKRRAAKASEEAASLAAAG